MHTVVSAVKNWFAKIEHEPILDQVMALGLEGFRQQPTCLPIASEERNLTTVLSDKPAFVNVRLILSTE